MAVTDPVVQVTGERVESDLAQNLPATIARLAQLPASTEAPYLSAYLDWRPDGTSPFRRPGRRAFTDETERLLAPYPEHSAARKSLKPDLDRLAAYLNRAPEAAQGIAVFACYARDVFEALPLGVPLPTAFAVNPTPMLRDLVAALDNVPNYAILNADQREANFIVVRQARPAAVVEVLGEDYPRHQAQGGWSQKRYQRRADERVEHFAKAVAEDVRVALHAGKLTRLVVLGDEVILPALDVGFHQTVKDRILGTMPGDIRATATDLVAHTLPLVRQKEREREAAAVQRARDLTKSGGPGVTGAADVLMALQAGQVQILVMNDDFSEPGWADYTLPLFGVGLAPSLHPAGGDADNIVPVSLPDELVRLALLADAEVEIVQFAVPISAAELDRIPDAHGDDQPRSDAARALDELGGVAAILRFALADDQQTASL